MNVPSPYAPAVGNFLGMPPTPLALHPKFHSPLFREYDDPQSPPPFTLEIEEDFSPERGQI